MVTFPYNKTDFAFTLDEKLIAFSTTKTKTFFELKVTIKHFNYFETREITSTLEYKIPLLNQKQQFAVGSKIHRFLSSPKSYSNPRTKGNKTAKVSFEAKEISEIDGSTQGTTTLNDVLFIPGKKPILFEANNAILTKNKHPERITKDGFLMVNLLLSAKTHEIVIFKNDKIVLKKLIIATASQNVFFLKVKVSDFGGAKGDIFSVKLTGTRLEKKLIIFPKNVNSKQLIFIDAFKNYRSLECTGHFSFSNKYRQTKHTYQREFLEVLEIIETDKTATIRINSGHILKTDTEVIDDLVMSKKAFLVENGKAILEMVPISKKIKEENSQEELYSYDLDFQINKNFNA